MLFTHTLRSQIFSSHLNRHLEFHKAEHGSDLIMDYLYASLILETVKTKKIQNLSLPSEQSLFLRIIPPTPIYIPPLTLIFS